MRLLEQYGQASQEHIGPVIIHLKVETGMHRLGFEESDLPDVVAALIRYPHLQVATMFSHLAASGTAAHDAFTHEQVDRFEAYYERFAMALGVYPLRHILNSDGIVRHPEHQMDMVRLGIGLYGISSDADVQQQLQVVHTLKGSVSQVKSVAPGGTVGYERSGVAARDMRIATISLGYADGLPLSASNGKHSVLVRGALAPIFGRVCMDMCMLDVTDIPDVQEGDTVTIYGEVPRLTTLARAAGTIPYELLTNISDRVKRVYFVE